MMTSEIPPDEGCMICDIAAGNVFAQTEHSIAFAYPEAFQRGHVAVGARRHVKSIGGLSPAEAADLGSLVAKVMAGLERATDVERIYMVAFGHRVPHFHWHLLPSYPDDPINLGKASIGVKTEWRLSTKKPTEDEIIDLASVMRVELD